MVEVRGQPWDLWEREVAVSLLFGFVAAPLALVAVAVFSAGSLGLRGEVKRWFPVRFYSVAGAGSFLLFSLGESRRNKRVNGDCGGGTTSHSMKISLLAFIRI